MSFDSDKSRSYNIFLELSADEQEAYIAREIQIKKNWDEYAKFLCRYEGREEGRKEGREEGREEERKKIILAMLEQNINIELVSKCVNLSVEKINKISSITRH
jgi:hypothetical protein